ncbi:Rhamnogalacturonate lyase, partial [Linum grandiflorum]
STGQGYNFWREADEKGNFVIKNVRPGDYNLDSYVPGVVGSFRHSQLITLKQGDDIKLGQITFKSPRSGPTLWEIGIPDRSANEFFVPNPNPRFENKFFLDKPKDKGDGDMYNSTTWKIVFNLSEVSPTGNYTLQIALAAAEMTNTFVYVNDVDAKRPHYATGTVGTDNAIARHGNHGLYRFFSGSLPSNLFNL